MGASHTIVLHMPRSGGYWDPVKQVYVHDKFTKPVPHGTIVRCVRARAPVACACARRGSRVPARASAVCGVHVCTRMHACTNTHTHTRAHTHTHNARTPRSLGNKSYRVVSAVRHLGNASTHGHYVAFVRAGETAWSCCDDSRVTPAAEAAALDGFATLLVCECVRCF